MNIFFVLLVLPLVLNPFYNHALAHEASDSSKFVDDHSIQGTTTSPPPAQQTQNVINISPSISNLDLNLPEAMDILLDQSSSQQLSAQVRHAPRLRKLTRDSFGANEKVQVKVDNGTSEPVAIKVKNMQGHEIELDISTSENSQTKTFIILPPSHLKPGKYTIYLTDAQGVTTEQNFFWGVLALNTNKAIYKPGEFVHFSMAVLDDLGKMVCDAMVELKITDPQGQQIILSTTNGLLKVNPECYVKYVTTIPDYEAELSVFKTGKYFTSLSATTNGGTHTINDTFEVADSVIFDINRLAPTRIYPINRYPVEITITANADFDGKIIEVVPENFSISQNLELAEVSEISVLDSESKGIGAAVLGESSSLGIPYEGTRDLTQEFGGRHPDPLIQTKYEAYGVTGHDGADFAMPSGTPIYAVADGTVVFSSIHGDYGTTIIIEHEWGKSYYGHLSELLVDTGSKVKRGDQIAMSGNTGLSTGPHLHFGIKLHVNNYQNGYYGKIDPIPFLGLKAFPIVLGTTIATPKVKTIEWNVNLKKGETKKIGYVFDAPDESPQFYTTGPLMFYSDNIKVYEEARKWQIAVDAATLNSSVFAGATRNGGQRHIAKDAFGNLFATYIDSNMDVRVSYSNNGGSTWTEYGTAIDLTADRVAVAIDYENNLHFAVDVTGGTVKYYRAVVNYVGTTIQSTGWTISSAVTIDTSTKSRFSSIVIDRNNFPAMAWTFFGDTGGEKTDLRFSRAKGDPTTESNWTCATGSGCAVTIGAHGADVAIRMNGGASVIGTIVKDPAGDGSAAWHDGLHVYETCTVHNNIHESVATVNGVDYNAWTGWSQNGNSLDTGRVVQISATVDPVNNKTWLTWSRTGFNTSLARFDIAANSLDNQQLVSWSNATRANVPNDYQLAFNRSTTNGEVYIIGNYDYDASNSNPGDILYRKYACTASSCSSGTFDSSDTIHDSGGTGTLHYASPSASMDAVVQNKDQSYEVDGSSLSYNVGRATAANGVRAAQTFKPSSSAGGRILTQIGVRLKKVGSPTDALKITVRDGTDGTIRAAGYIGGAALTTSAKWYYIKLDSGTTLTANTTYYIQVERTSTTSDTNYYQWVRDTTSLYSNGGAYQFTTSWSAESSTTDMDFITYYETYPRIEVIYTRKTASSTYDVYYNPITITAASTPTNDQLLRHGRWFDNGTIQPFTF